MLNAGTAGRNDFIRYSHKNLAYAFKKLGRFDSAYYYSRQALDADKNAQDMIEMQEVALLLADLFKTQKQFDSAYTYLSFYTALKEQSRSNEKIKEVQALLFSETVRQQQLKQEQKEAQQQYTTRVKVYGLLSGIGVLLLLAIIRYRNNQQKQKANQKLEQAYQELQTTQAQLIQSEKMASLGELTAGIAHEIQNPLNFVNNFSDTNIELLQEAEYEFKTGNKDEGLSILASAIGNEQKINHHGRRADAIVKSMLEHSRSSKGEKQLTYINALTDEYLRLSYHGFRAKDRALMLQ